MSFSLCVVLHNSERELGALLDSIDAHLSDRPQIICADSGATDDGAALARSRGAAVIVMDGNPGFGAANNAALSAATEDVAVLLNPDCRLIDGSLERLVTAAGNRRGLMVPRLLNENRTVQDSAHPLPGGWDGYLAALTAPRLLPRRLRERLQPFRSDHEIEVGWATGACIAGQTALLRELGPFNPDDFLFAEDLDLCLRARAHAIPTILDPSVALIHTGAHTSEGRTDDARLELQVRRRREVIGRQLGANALARDDRSQALTFALRAAARRDRDRNLIQLKALRAAQNRSS